LAKIHRASIILAAMDDNWIFVNLDLLIQSAIVGVIAFYLIVRVGGWLVGRSEHRSREPQRPRSLN
jgi:hypothetical protein